MKTKALVFAAIAALSSSAFAQSYEYRDRVGDRYERSAYQDRYDRGDRYNDGRYDRGDRYNDGRYDRYHRRDGYDRGHRRMEGAGPRGDLFIGTPLPKYLFTVSHRVDNWQRLRLGAPGYRQHWVRAGNDFVLVSQTTGRITRVVLR